MTTWCRGRHPRSSRRAGDRGGTRRREDGATSTELAIVLPAVMLAMSFALQFGLYLHAAQIAEAAAQHAVDVAQGDGGTAARGSAAADALLADLPALRSPTVSVDRSADVVVARVDGQAPAVVPGAALAVSATARGPVERFVAEPGS